MGRVQCPVEDWGNLCVCPSLYPFASQRLAQISVRLAQAILKLAQASQRLGQASLRLSQAYHSLQKSGWMDRQMNGQMDAQISPVFYLTSPLWSAALISILPFQY